MADVKAAERRALGRGGITLAIGAALLTVGLLAASPLFCNRLVGNGDAYNYSLSVADAVVQLRHGHVPLVGQTEYAFNGRIHPLRNAPYLHYLAAAIDAITLHRLSFWGLLNASLALSLIAAVFACYGGLRWATGCSRFAAFFLSAVYGLSPALLAAAHQLDLFMTVEAAVFVPLAVAACLRGCLQPSFATDSWLAAALAAAWLAHPPVALWLTGGVIFVRGLDFLRRPGWRVLGSGVGAAVLGLALAGFGFASAYTLGSALGDFGPGRSFAGDIMVGLHRAFPADLLPVSRKASALSDLQFGYVPWLLLGLTLVGLLRRGAAGTAPGRSPRFAALAATLVTVFLLILLLPVPFLTPWLWSGARGLIITMTTIWPMQRLYLVAVGFGVFATALILPSLEGAWRRHQFLLRIAVVLAGLWTLYQAEPFVALGFRLRWTAVETAAAYRPSNRDLTVTSYAFLGTPPTFNYGVIDPEFEFRVLKDGRDELTSPLAAASAAAPVVKRGSLLIPPHTGSSGTAVSGLLALQPGHRYLLTFAFRRPPVHGVLSLVGPLISRKYGLPESGQNRGFGMLPGERRTIPLWTDSDQPELIDIQVDCADPAADPGVVTDFADFTLQEVDLAALPVRLQSLLPLRFAVDQPEANSTVETPRRFIAGYEATVNGQPVTPTPSPYGQVMVPVPAGHSVVELSYRGPALVRAAFWVSAVSWLAFLAAKALGWRIRRGTGSAIRRRIASSAAFVRRRPQLALAGLFALLAIFAGVVLSEKRRVYLREVGPVQIEFRLPAGNIGVNQPLLATGRPGAGVIVFVTILDSDHVRLSADVWGTLYQSRPLAVDPFKPQTLVVSDSALYPLAHPRVAALDPAERNRLRGELRLVLDGSTALVAKCYGYESEVSEILVGRTHMGSLTVPQFSGEILKAERLPIPSRSAGP